MRDLSLEELAQMIDISCVKSDKTVKDIDKMVAAVKEYGFVCAFALPGLTPYLVKQLKRETHTMTGGTVGFPSGGDTTQSKVFQAEQLLEMGCGELDMVIQIAQLKSQNYDSVYQDIKAVTDAAGKVPVKTILEVTLLTDSEIAAACKIAEQAGTSYIKTGTGWCPEPTQLRHIEFIKSIVQPQTKIKAAGGIRNLDTLLEMKQAGCDRFGISVHAALQIMAQAKATKHH